MRFAVIMKVVTYSVTLAAAMFCGYWELRLKRELTDDAPQLPVRPSDSGFLSNIADKLRRSDIADRMRRELYMDLPEQALAKYHRAVVLKFVFAAILVAEVIILQR
jgi:hypothetical protein